MDTNTLVRVIAGVLVVVIAAIIISRRKKSA
jgi:LPXTG-motif cell wall-anchored protein